MAMVPSYTNTRTMTFISPWVRTTCINLDSRITSGTMGVGRKRAYGLRRPERIRPGFTATLTSHMPVGLPGELHQTSLEGYGQIYRKDINAHSGGLLIYTSVSLISNQIHDLETLLPESIWVEVKDHSHSYLICNIYRPPHSSNEFWHRLNICLENASELANYIVLVGDINEDQMNLGNHKFRDILLLNNMINVINEPTRVSERSQTLIDPIAISNNLMFHDSGILKTSPDISDHFATFAFLNFDIQLASTYKRKVWYYNKGRLQPFE